MEFYETAGSVAPSSVESSAPKLDARNRCEMWWFQIFLMFTPILGEMIQLDLDIFFFKWLETTNWINFFRSEVLNFRGVVVGNFSF